MAVHSSLVISILLSFLVANCYGNILFSSLKPTLVVTSTQPEHVLKAGEDKITVTWHLDTSLPDVKDTDYKTVKVKLCYAPISQKDRGWRKTVDNLAKDKTCQHKIVARPYSRSNNTFTYTVQRDVPSATYFIRAYVYNSTDEEVAYGQTTDSKKQTNLFSVQAISGRHASLDIASAVFSAFSIVSLFGFFVMEKRKAKALSK